MNWINEHQMTKGVRLSEYDLSFPFSFSSLLLKVHFDYVVRKDTLKPQLSSGNTKNLGKWEALLWIQTVPEDTETKETLKLNNDM